MKQHLLPSSEARPAGAVGSPALGDAPATVQAGEVLATLLRGERPPGESKGQPESTQVLGKGRVFWGSGGMGLARVINTVLGVSRKEFDVSEKGNTLRNNL